MASTLSRLLTLFYISMDTIISEIIDCPSSGQCGPCTNLSPGEECILDCRGDLHCHYFQTAVCTDGHPCQILCQGENACDGLMVYAMKATSVYWSCDSQRTSSNTNNNCCVRSQMWAANVTGTVEIDCVTPNSIEADHSNGNCNKMNVTCGTGDCNIQCGDDIKSKSCLQMQVDASLSSNYQCTGTECDEISAVITTSPTIDNVNIEIFTPSPTTTSFTPTTSNPTITASTTIPQILSSAETSMYHTTDSISSSQSISIALSTASGLGPVNELEAGHFNPTEPSSHMDDHSTQTDTILGFDKLTVFIAGGVLFCICCICMLFSIMIYRKKAAAHKIKHQDTTRSNINKTLRIQMGSVSNVYSVHSKSTMTNSAPYSPMSLSIPTAQSPKQIEPDSIAGISPPYGSIQMALSLGSPNGENIINPRPPSPMFMADDILPESGPVLHNNMESITSMQSDYDIDILDVMTPDGNKCDMNHLDIIMDNEEDKQYDNSAVGIVTQGNIDKQEIGMDEFVIEGDDMDYVEADEFVVDGVSDRKLVMQTAGANEGDHSTKY